MSVRISSSELKNKVLPGLVAGLSRRPLVGELWEGADAGLKALSLTAQALRFELPAAPPSFAVERGVEDARRIMPEQARRRLIRLLQSRRTTGEVEQALAWTYEGLKMRPHPFDLPRMESFVRAHAERLGATAQQWVARRLDQGGQEPVNFYADQALEDATWMHASPARRARYLEDRRRTDAEAARALLEAAWTQPDADARVRLLGALAIGLTAADQALLESAKADRAPRVRALAERLLSRLPGAGGEHPALKACLERITKTQMGLLRKRTVLKLELPATVKEHTAKQWVRETFAEVTWGELARALNLPEQEMIAAAAEDGNLQLGLAVMATQEARLDLLERLVSGQLKDAWEQMTQTGAFDLSAMTQEQRLRWAEILAAPYGGDLPRSVAVWRWMLSALEQPMPERTLLAVLHQEKWLDAILSEGRWENEWTMLLAAACPRGLRDRLRRRFDGIDPSWRVEAEQLMEILDAMEKA
jgi:hypothetical protein